MKELKADKSKTNVSEIIQKILNPKNEMIYYHGGLFLLETILTDSPETSLLFESSDGFKLFKTPPGIVID